MKELKLPRYGLSNYIDEKNQQAATDSEKQMLENLSRAGKRMMGFCRTNFFKRLDSSGVSFLISLYRHILRNSIYLYAIENNLKLPIGDEGELPDGYNDDEDLEATLFDEMDKKSEVERNDAVLTFPTNLDSYKNKAKEYYLSIAKNNNVKWIDSKFFKRALKQHIQADSEKLLEMIKHCGAWEPQSDQKLKALEDLLEKSHKNEKVIVFTQFADTANYVAEQLKKRGVKKIECVTGSSESPTRIAEHFSPVSNEKQIPESEQYRVLIATDVLSEGQNLQDSHIVVNYDLPWAIIRLIQRAGRVDRIGQTADEIYCYSFFPAKGVEDIIKLRHRLGTRINENANIVGSDEIFFEGNEQNLMNMYNEVSGTLDDEEDTDVDLASQAYQIWKTATDANPELKHIIQNLSNVVYSTKKNDKEKIREGVITYSKTASGNDMLTWMNKKGEIVMQSQQTILHALACSITEPALEPLENHHELTGKSVELIQKQEGKNSGSGILGNRLSTKYQLFDKLDGYCKNQKGELFLTDELKLAVDDIYNYPLQNNAKTMLRRQLNRGEKIEDIADFVVELRKNDELCIINDEEMERKEPQIICSMGLKNEEYD
jgi:superfamily II DNA/RNA helicase